MRQHPQMRHALRPLAENCHRSIGRGIIDDDNLEAAQGGQRAINIFDQGDDILGLIAGRNDDRDLSHRISSQRQVKVRVSIGQPPLACK